MGRATRTHLSALYAAALPRRTPRAAAAPPVLALHAGPRAAVVLPRHAPPLLRPRWRCMQCLALLLSSRATRRRRSSRFPCSASHPRSNSRCSRRRSSGCRRKLAHPAPLQPFAPRRRGRNPRRPGEDGARADQERWSSGPDPMD